MNIALWVIAGLLAAAFLLAGTMKTITPKEQLKAKGMGWVDDYTDTQVKLIGAAEALGAIGLILPPLLGIAEILAPIAAVGLVIIMVGAVLYHVRKHEPFTPALVLGILAAVVAVGRFITGF